MAAGKVFNRDWNSERLRDKAGELRDKTTELTSDVRDRVENRPTPIGATAHAVIDYIHAGTFFFLAFAFAGRNKRAAAAAGLLGGQVLANALCTDYPGGYFRLWNFRKHGLLDVGAAGLSAAAPELFGFSGEPEAKYFRLLGAGETGIVALTDYSDETGAYADYGLEDFEAA